MKFLFFTDPHIRTISPRYRKDNFYETILKKLEWVRETGEKHDVEAYICGGDWLDRPDIPYATLSGLAEVLSKFNKKIYTVLGNHDIYGYNPSTHIRTALSVLRASGLIHRLSQDPIILEDGGVKVGISGVDAHYFLDRNGRVSDYTDVKIVPGATRIHVVHGFLAKKAWPEIPMTEIKSVINTNADILLTGHDHSGFGVHAENNRLICNPGALGRPKCFYG
jgi:DNA repair exonuclease SbcCD nuclease subunit